MQVSHKLQLFSASVPDTYPFFFARIPYALLLLADLALIDGALARDSRC